MELNCYCCNCIISFRIVFVRIEKDLDERKSIEITTSLSVDFICGEETIRCINIPRVYVFLRLPDGNVISSTLRDPKVVFILSGDVKEKQQPLTLEGLLEFLDKLNPNLVSLKEKSVF